MNCLKSSKTERRKPLEKARRGLRFRSVLAMLPFAALLSISPVASAQSTTSINVDGRVLHAAIASSNSGQSEIVIARVKRGDDGVVKRFIARYAMPSGGSEGAGAKQLYETRVPDDVVAFGLGDFLGEGRAQIVYFTAESVFVLPSADPDAAPVKLLGPHRFIFNRSTLYTLPFWDQITDLNGDKLDDLIIADSEGYAIYFQSADHKLALAGRPKVEYDFTTRAELGGFLPTELGASEDTQGEWGSPWRRGARRTGGFTPGAQPILTTRSINRMGRADANADGRADLLILKGDRLLTFFQKEGAFSSDHDRARDFTGEVTKHAWDEGRFALGYGDLTGDSRFDLVLTEIDTQDLTTKVRLYLGTDSGIADQPAQVLKLTGLGDNPQLRDVNGDGSPDLCFLVIRADKILALRKASVEELEAAYYVYLFDKSKNQFTTRPDIRREFTVSLTGDIEREQSQEFFTLADTNGDGVEDLVCYENKGSLNVFSVTASGSDRMNLKLASSPSITVTTSAPSSIETTDLDGDGKDEIILIHSNKIQIVKN